MKEKKFIKQLSKDTIKSLLIVFFCVLIGVALLGLAYLIPINKIENNMYVTGKYICQEGMYPKLFDWCTSRLDNSTDSIMLLEASDNTKDTLLNRIMYCYNGTINDDGQYNSLVDKYVNNIEFNGVTTYARYWHGFIIFLRPLLVFFSYKEIRILNMMVQALLLLCIFYVLYRSNLKQYIIPYLFSILMIMPLCIALSLQFSSCYYIFNIGVLAILLLNKFNKLYNYWTIFLLLGIATAYFDFLTYPIATLCTPLIIYIVINKEHKKELFADVIRACFFWCIGYSFMWVSKWMLADLLTGSETIKDAINESLFRINAIDMPGTGKHTRMDAINENLSKFFFTPFKYLVFLYICLEVLLIIKRKPRINVISTSLFLIIIIIPFMWYFIVSNHSMIHAYFTNKALVSSVMSLMFCLTYLANY